MDILVLVQDEGVGIGKQTAEYVIQGIRDEKKIILQFIFTDYCGCESYYESSAFCKLSSGN